MMHHANHSAAGSPRQSLGRILSLAIADEAPGGRERNPSVGAPTAELGAQRRTSRAPRRRALRW